METYTIDATGKRVGRVASEAARALRGKHRSDFRPDRDAAVRVTISNASQMRIDDAKRKGHIYTRYSRYPGGLKKESMERVIDRKGHAEVLHRAVYGMLPANRLRARVLKRLTITG